MAIIDSGVHAGDCSTEVGSDAETLSAKGMSTDGSSCDVATQCRADRDNKRINRQITASATSGSIDPLLQVINVNLESMNLINLSTSIHRIAKMALHCNPHVRDRILSQKVMSRLRRACSTRIAESVEKGLQGGWRHDPVDKASAMRSMSIICWSCATLRLREDALFSCVASLPQADLSEMKPFELSNLLWAFAKVSAVGPEFFDSFAPWLINRVPGSYSPQCLSTIIWAYGMSKVHVRPLFASFAKELAIKARNMGPQGISNTAWAFARVRHVDALLFKALAEAAAQEDNVWNFKPQELCNTAWAFAIVGLPNPVLFDRMAQVVLARRWEFPPQNIANMLWAYAKLLAPSRNKLFGPLLEVAAGRLNQYKPQEISAILWAAAREETGQNTEVCRTFIAQVPEFFHHRLGEFTTQVLACVAEALILVELDNTHFFVEVMKESLKQLWDFGPPSLCTLLRGLVLRTRRIEYAETDKETYLEVVCSHIEWRTKDLLHHNLIHLDQTLDLLPPRFLTGAVKRLGGTDALLLVRKRLNAGTAAPKLSVVQDKIDPTDLGGIGLRLSSDLACAGDFGLGEYGGDVLRPAVNHIVGYPTAGVECQQEAAKGKLASSTPRGVDGSQLSQGRRPHKKKGFRNRKADLDSMQDAGQHKGDFDWQPDRQRTVTLTKNNSSTRAESNPPLDHIREFPSPIWEYTRPLNTTEPAKVSLVSRRASMFTKELDGMPRYVNIFDKARFSL